MLSLGMVALNEFDFPLKVVLINTKTDTKRKLIDIKEDSDCINVYEFNIRKHSIYILRIYSKRKILMVEKTIEI